MKKSYRITIVTSLLILIFVLIPIQTASADVGPKPTMMFELEYHTAEILSIEEINLLLCDDKECLDSRMMEKQLGPQDIDCISADQCNSMAYGYADFHKLIIQFSDGITRESNIFKKKQFNAHYQVMVYDDNLVVDEKASLFNVSVLAVAGSCLFLLCGIGLIVFLILAILRERQERFTLQQSLWVFIVIWMICLPAILTGTYFSWTILITVILEGLIAVGLTFIYKKDLVKFLTVVTLGNVLTQLLLLFVVNGIVFGYSAIGLVVVEIFIWLIEAGIIFGTMQQNTSFRKAMLFSLIINAISFITGLLLPAGLLTNMLY
ncbi:MAG: hypothetical protein JEZ06_09430 [Anaerolineaceae bacterium]|nr:hypothetical protein [Anaerolineaceae bacterium]